MFCADNKSQLYVCVCMKQTRKTRTFVRAWASRNDVSLWALEDVRQWSREQLHFQPPLINFAGTINSQRRARSSSHQPQKQMDCVRVCPKVRGLDDQQFHLRKKHSPKTIYVNPATSANYNQLPLQIRFWHFITCKKTLERSQRRKMKNSLKIALFVLYALSLKPEINLLLDPKIIYIIFYLGTTKGSNLIKITVFS